MASSQPGEKSSSDSPLSENPAPSTPPSSRPASVKPASEKETSGVRSVGPLLRATMAAFRCELALDLHDFARARLEYWVLQQALEELDAGCGQSCEDPAIQALQVRGRDLGRMLAIRLTPREFKRSDE